VRIVAHRKTREMMMGPALAFNKPGLDTQLPAYIQGLEKRLTETEATPGAAPAEIARQKSRLAENRFFLEQKRGVRHTFPNVTFTDALDIHMGGRLIQVRHLDRAVTPGDAFLYLPAEKVVVTGDLLVNPVSFALSCYPAGWVRTLEHLEGLDADVVIPGHGEPLRDKQLLRDTLAVFRALRREGAAAWGRGEKIDKARAAAMAAIEAETRRITKGDRSLVQAFEVQLVDWFLHRVYDELAGPLDDTIAPIPAGK
jgi:glyoxylase-like metal-dependent hydrolase (beta-lactamase superfamily II)